MGVWISLNKGAEWAPLGVDLATTIVNDIKIHAPTYRMVAGTFGRSIFSIDLNIVSSTVESDNVEFEMFPNPASSDNRININTDYNDFTVYVFDINGRSVMSIKNQKTFTHSLKSGRYTVVIIADNKRSSQKLIIQ
jgi:hypothetical protein